MKKARTWISAIGSGVLTFLMLILLALAVVLIVIPKAMGGMSLTVLTGSMEPGIMPGDIVVTKGIDTESARDLKIGDVISFLPYPDDPTLVTHRIIAQSVSQKGTSFITQGDNNNVADSWNPVHDFQVRGKLLYVIPKLGYVRQWLGARTTWVIIGAAVLLFGYAIYSFASSFRKHDDDQDEEPVAKPRRAYEKGHR